MSNLEKDWFYKLKEQEEKDFETLVYRYEKLIKKYSWQLKNEVRADYEQEVKMKIYKMMVMKPIDSLMKEETEKRVFKYVEAICKNTRVDFLRQMNPNYKIKPTKKYKKSEIIMQILFENLDKYNQEELILLCFFYNEGNSITLNELAKKMGKSKSTIQYRIQKMLRYSSKNFNNREKEVKKV